MLDGIIKYSIEHQKQDIPLFSGYEQLEALRTRLFTLGLIGEKDGIGYGNLSIRDDNSKSFFITATQTGRKQTLSREYYTYISDYDFSTFKVISQGTHKPSSEALSHAMIYEIDDRITTVIHIHSLALWKFMKAKNDLATTAEYGTAEMVEEIAGLYTNLDPMMNNAFVMKGHEEGIITFGRSVEEAELVLYTIMQAYLQEGF
ncbi:class II aldolase/adducin family protein [Sulfurovum sp. CS9]|uniref:class II aldolase/adducin family protein n=1 Tax=Sulfurovum sp. CS9 TaxID=3391146 RepID=UPI0039E8F595